MKTPLFSSFSPQQLRFAIEYEMRFRDDPKIASDIAIGRLTENPNYYDKFAKMEKANQLSIGTKIESEHKETVDFIRSYVKKNGKMPPDKEIYKHISMNHTEKEMKDYYTRLIQMEEQAKKDKKRPQIEIDVIKFLITNPNPPDSKIHAFAESKGLDPSKLETVVYQIATERAKMSTDMFKARIVKYIRKERMKDGKFKYYYADGTHSTTEKEKPFNVVEAFKNFFGLSDEKIAKEKIKKDYYEHKISAKYNLSLLGWADHLSEYFIHKDKWDSKFSNKTPETKADDAKKDTNAEKKASTPSEKPKFNTNAMKEIYDLYNKKAEEPIKETAKESEAIVEPVKETSEQKAKDIQISTAINTVTPENRNEKENEILNIPELTEPEKENIIEPTVEFVPDYEVVSIPGLIVEGKNNSQHLLKSYLKVKPKDILLQNEKTILTKEKPSYIPEVDEKFLKGAGFVIPTYKLETDKYLIQTNAKRKVWTEDKKWHIAGEDTYIIVNRDVLAATYDYFIKKAKMLKKEETKKRQEKYPDYKVTAERITVLTDKKMSYDQQRVFSYFIRNVTGFSGGGSKFMWEKYKEIREDIAQKTSDMEIQLEDYYNAHAKGRETSYGDKGTNDSLLSTLGVKVKRQNGAEITSKEITEIKDAVDDVFSVFGNRSSMAKNFGLKISHAGDKNMHARKAAGIFIPSLKVIGVTTQYGNGTTGFVLAHEWSHFMDFYVGEKNDRHYISDNPNHVAGEIADTFRKNMKKQQKSAYYNRTCECFARALEQYWAIKTNSTDILQRWDSLGTHPEENIFKEKVMPLIDRFLSENDQLLKAFFNDNFNKNKNILIKSFDRVKGVFVYRRMK